MRASALLLILCYQTISAFQLRYVSLSPFVRVRDDVRCNIIIYSHNDVVGNDADWPINHHHHHPTPRATITIAENQHASSSTSVVTTRQTFLATALVASTITSVFSVPNAYAVDIAGK